jgi:hypothetical protein
MHLQESLSSPLLSCIVKIPAVRLRGIANRLTLLAWVVLQQAYVVACQQNKALECHYLKPMLSTHEVKLRERGLLCPRRLAWSS